MKTATDIGWPDKVFLFMGSPKLLYYIIGEFYS